MSRPRMTESQKVFLLNLIRERKEDLFAAFSSTVTASQKAEKWSCIIDRCRDEHGFDPSNGRGWQYLRDSTWPNIKNYAVAKRDKFRRSGAEGGESARFSDVDIVVFDIIGKDTPVLDGLTLEIDPDQPTPVTPKPTEEPVSRPIFGSLSKK